MNAKHHADTLRERLYLRACHLLDKEVMKCIKETKFEKIFINLKLGNSGIVVDVDPGSLLLATNNRLCTFDLVPGECLLIIIRDGDDELVFGTPTEYIPANLTLR